MTFNITLIFDIEVILKRERVIFRARLRTAYFFHKRLPSVARLYDRS